MHVPEETLTYFPEVPSNHSLLLGWTCIHKIDPEKIWDIVQDMSQKKNKFKSTTFV